MSRAGNASLVSAAQVFNKLAGRGLVAECLHEAQSYEKSVSDSSEFKLPVSLVQLVFQLVVGGE